MKAWKLAFAIFIAVTVLTAVIADASISKVGKVSLTSISKVAGKSAGSIVSIAGSNVTSTPAYALNLLYTGNGTVTKNPNKAYYSAGESVTLTASADSGYQFYSYDDGSNPSDTVPSHGLESDTLVVTMNADYTVTANFAYLIETYVTDGAHGGYGAANAGIIFSTNYDGDSATPGHVTTSTGTKYPNAKYFMEGSGFTSDYPMALLDHNNPTVENVVFDSCADIGDGYGGEAPSGGSLTVMVRSASVLQNCTLNRAHKYGLGFWDTKSGCKITGCTVTWAQYCVSGSHNVTDTEVSWNNLSGMGLVGVKIKDMQHCTIEHNYIDVTPNNYWTSGQSKYGFDWSDDVAGMHGNVVQLNTVIRVSQGAYPTIQTGGCNVDTGVNDSGGNSFIDNVVNLPNAGWARMYGVILGAASDYMTITGNTFTNCYPADDAILGSGAGHCTLTPNTVIP